MYGWNGGLDEGRNEKVRIEWRNERAPLVGTSIHPLHPHSSYLGPSTMKGCPLDTPAYPIHPHYPLTYLGPSTMDVFCPSVGPGT